jgi:hypothetical protein
MDAASVCRSIETSRRREALSFTHHREVAALSVDQQDNLLDRAEKYGHSTRSIREEAARLRAPALHSEPVDSGGPTITHLHASLEPAEPMQTMRADDFANAILEGAIKDIQMLENRFQHIPFLKDGLADLRRQASARLKPAPAKNSGIRVVK